MFLFNQKMFLFFYLDVDFVVDYANSKDQDSEFSVKLNRTRSTVARET